MCSLKRNDDEVRGTKRRRTGQRKIRRTVQQNVIVIIDDRGQCSCHRELQICLLPGMSIRQVERLQPRRRRNHVDVYSVGLLNELPNLWLRSRIEELFNSEGLRRCRQAAGDTGLWVEIDHEDTPCSCGSD